MRSISVKCGTIRISSAAGELRLVSVSGIAKIRLLWLFRNFSILDYSVLTKAQQQLVAGAWQAGYVVRASDESDVIGTVEQMPPQPDLPPVPARPAAAVAVRAAKPHRHSRFAMPSARSPVIWTAAGVLLLGSTMYLPQRFLPQPELPLRAAAVADAPSPVRPAAPVMARISVATAPPVTAPLAAIPKSSGPAALHPPDAMAGNASSPLGLASDTWVVNSKAVSTKAASAKATGRPEVILRVSVDRKGHAQTVEVVSGNQSKIPKALNAAKVWHFEPCADADTCEHSLKYTDFGDASSVQVTY